MLGERNNSGKSKKRDTLRLLAVADHVEPQLYNSGAHEWFLRSRNSGLVDLLISCGDLPPYYLDFLTSTLNAPILHVLGNHCDAPHHSQLAGGGRQLAVGSLHPALRVPHSSVCYAGAENLHGRVVSVSVYGHASPLLVAGLEGSPWYNGGPHQYTEQQVAWTLSRMVPRLLLNKLRTGRYLDVLVTHTPPRGIQDCDDPAHKGFTSLIPFIERFRPALLLHGHSHRYNPMDTVRTRYKNTNIVNAYGHILLELVESKGQGSASHSGWHLKTPKRSIVSHG